jgi:hypothetical protein
MQDVERWRRREAVERLVAAARAWAPTRLTRTDSEARERLCAAVAALDGVDVEDLHDAIREAGREAGHEEERAVHFG